MLLLTLPGLYYKLHGLHRPSTMKKSTIKRRKRVIPASQEEEVDETMEDAAETQSQEKTPERGTINDDGSINLGFRRRPEHPLTIEPEPVMRSLNRQTPPSQTKSDLAAYHQSATLSRTAPTFLNDDNRLAPLTSMSMALDRQTSLSPASFLSPSRKRSFSSAEAEPNNLADTGYDNAKRISSIKSILNPSVPAESSNMTGAGSDDGNEYPPRPLRSPASTTNSGPSPGPFSMRDNTPATSTMSGGHMGAYDETEYKLRADRRAALQREADRMREMLAAKERELLELGND